MVFFFGLKLPLLLFRLLIYELFPSVKWYFSPDLNFYLIFLYFLMFLSSTCCGVCLFVDFCVSDLDGSTTLIR